MSSSVKSEYDLHKLSSISPSDNVMHNESQQEQSDHVNEQETHEDHVEINMEEIDKAISESMTETQNRIQQETIRREAERAEDAKRNHSSLTSPENAEDSQKRQRVEETSNPEHLSEEPTQLRSETESSGLSQKTQTEVGRDVNINAQAGDHISDKELELQFERAIRDHEAENSKHMGETDFNEKNDLQFMANELQNATSSKDDRSHLESTGLKENDEFKTLHGDVSVPLNSELLNTNTAFAAYNVLSTQLPPLSILANAHLSALPLSIVAADYLPPRIQLLINTLPTLDNLATQLLRIVAIGPYQKVLDLAAHPDTPAGAAFRDLTSLFEYSKRLYSEDEPFLTVEHVAPGMWKEGEKTPSALLNREQLIELTLRKVNLATFLGATLGTIEVGFFYLNESFLDVFCPSNSLDPSNSLSNMNSNTISLQGGSNSVVGDKIGKLLKPQAVLFLDLKTQAYISAIEAGERSREEILEDILPQNLDEILMERRKTKVLTPTEVDFVERCRSRKKILLDYPPEKNLGEEYEWLTFLKDVIDFASKNMAFLIWGRKGRAVKEKNVPTKVPAKSKTPHSDETLASTSELQNALSTKDGAVSSDDRNIAELTSALLPSEIQEQQIHLRLNPGSGVKSSHRRPWTREEEKALRHALELKGPLWSTILELFGAGGKISEALKNRTQVQLKDKARNWKMFFLKSGLPVPHYLQKVTGDLERDDRLKLNKRLNRNKKTAAAPVPTPLNNSSS